MDRPCAILRTSITAILTTGQAPHPRTLHLAPKFHWLRHHHAARRRDSDHLSRSCPYEGSHGAVGALAGSVYTGAQISREAESFLHHTGRPGSGSSERMYEADGGEGYPRHCYWWLVWRRGERRVLQGSRHVYGSSAREEAAICHGRGTSFAAPFACGSDHGRATLKILSYPLPLVPTCSTVSGPHELP
jgi:hypothetical protein